MSRPKQIVAQERHNLVGTEQEQTIREREIEFVAALLNSIVTEDGVEALQGQTWVSLIVNKAHKMGIRNASEEMLIERFKNEGLIKLDKDVDRLRTENFYNPGHLAVAGGIA
jgi:hypothetical protein